MVGDVSRLDWYAEFRARLRTVRYFRPEEVDALVAEVEEYCADSGERPEDAFGTADEYAQGIVRERVPEVERARRGVDDLTAVDMLVATGLLIGLHLIIYTIVLLVSGDWVVELTVAVLAGWAAVGLVGVVLALGSAARRAGRLRLGTCCWIAAVPLVVLAGVLFTQLPRIPLGQVWSALLGAVGLVMLAVLLPRLGRVSRRRRIPADPDDVEQWFRRLHGLLVGRHEIGRGPARAIVAESRAHLRRSEVAMPQEEFGPVEQYALRVAEQADHRPPWWHRQEIVTPAMSLLWLTVFLISFARGEGGFQLWSSLVAAVLFAGVGVLAWRRAHQVQ